MAKWKLKASKDDVEQAGSQQDGFTQAPVGYYVLEITQMTVGPNKSGDGQRAEVILKPVKTFKDGVTGPLPEAYGQVWDYLSDSESSGWKRAQFGLALGFTVKRGQIQEDIEMEPGKPGSVIGKQVLARLRKDTDLDGNYRPKIATYLPKETLDNAEEGGDEVEYEDTESEETEDDTAAEDDEAPDFEELGEQADGDDEEAIESLTEWAAEYSIDPDEYETWAEVAAAIAEAHEGGEEGEDEEGEEDAGEEGDDAEGGDDDFYTEESLTAMDREELREAAANFDLDLDDFVKKFKGKAKAKLIEAILEAQGVEDPF